MSGLTREEILKVVDIDVREITLPKHLKGWGGRTIFIRQLTRGEQDEYLRRQYGSTRMKQNLRERNQEISAVNIYGHDAYLVVCGLCDQNGKRLLQKDDIDALSTKNGEAIGFIAAEIVEFSGMKGDVEVFDKAKNSSTTPTESSDIDSGHS